MIINHRMARKPLIEDEARNIEIKLAINNLTAINDIGVKKGSEKTFLVALDFLYERLKEMPATEAISKAVFELAGIKNITEACVSGKHGFSDLTVKHMSVVLIAKQMPRLQQDLREIFHIKEQG
jgi:hypothetical protein